MVETVSPEIMKFFEKYNGFVRLHLVTVQDEAGGVGIVRVFYFDKEGGNPKTIEFDSAEAFIKQCLKK